MKEKIILKAKTSVQKTCILKLLVIIPIILFVEACTSNSQLKLEEQPLAFTPESTTISETPNLPTVEPPMPESPITESPVPELPVQESPIAELPLTELPAPELPTLTSPVSEAPQETRETEMIAQEEKLPVPLEQQPPVELLPIPAIPEYILGNGQIKAEMLSEFLVSYHPEMYGFAQELALLYVEEAAIEGVNHDAAFAQMCLETGFLRFGGLVLREMNNFCGLGAISIAQRGESFPDSRTGVRAHIQHLKAYATEQALEQELVDPRYFYVRLGSSPKISGLAGTWASDLQYAVKINSILERLYEFSFQNNYTIN